MCLVAKAIHIRRVRKQRGRKLNTALNYFSGENKAWKVCCCAVQKPFIRALGTKFEILGRFYWSSFSAASTLQRLSWSYSAETLVSRHEHKITIVKIPIPRSRAYWTTMQRSFGTDISRNRRPRSKPLEVVRARIITVLG